MLSSKCYVITLWETSMWGTRFKQEHMRGVEVYKTKDGANQRAKEWGTSGNPNSCHIKEVELKG